MEKVIIDTDPGQDIDDLMAIWYVLLRPEFAIKAITTVTYPTDKRSRLIKRLLRYLERKDIPVASGISFPLRQMTPDEIRDQKNEDLTMNHYAFAEPEDPIDTPDNHNAVSLIINTIMENPGEIVIACIAPLTNIASAILKQPDIVKKIKCIRLMGGELHQNKIEHNIGWDYLAAEVVMNSGVPIYMGTWDVTRKFYFSIKECDIFRNHASELTKKMGKAIDLWYREDSWKPGPVIYDIFPFASSFYTFRKESIEVISSGEKAGQTVLSGKNDNTFYTTDIKAEEIKKLFLETVLG